MRYNEKMNSCHHVLRKPLANLGCSLILNCFALSTFLLQCLLATETYKKKQNKTKPLIVLCQICLWFLSSRPSLHIQRFIMCCANSGISLLDSSLPSLPPRHLSLYLYGEGGYQSSFTTDMNDAPEKGNGNSSFLILNIHFFPFIIRIWRERAEGRGLGVNRKLLLEAMGVDVITQRECVEKRRWPRREIWCSPSFSALNFKGTTEETEPSKGTEEDKAGGKAAECVVMRTKVGVHYFLLQRR